MVAASGDTLEETVLLTKVAMDTDLITGQAGILNLQEMLIFSKKYFCALKVYPSLYSFSYLVIANTCEALKYMSCTP